MKPAPGEQHCKRLYLSCQRPSQGTDREVSSDLFRPCRQHSPFPLSILPIFSKASRSHLRFVLGRFRIFFAIASMTECLAIHDTSQQGFAFEPWISPPLRAAIFCAKPHDMSACVQVILRKLFEKLGATYIKLGNLPASLSELSSYEWDHHNRRRFLHSKSTQLDTSITVLSG